MINQIRLLIAETLLGWVVSIAPKDKEGQYLIEAIHSYSLKAAGRSISQQVNK